MGAEGFAGGPLRAKPILGFRNFAIRNQLTRLWYQRVGGLKKTAQGKVAECMKLSSDLLKTYAAVEFSDLLEVLSAGAGFTQTIKDPDGGEWLCPPGLTPHGPVAATPLPVKPGAVTPEPIPADTPSSSSSLTVPIAAGAGAISLALLLALWR